MKVTMPNDVPFMSLAKFAAENGYVITSASGEHVTMEKANTENVAPFRRREDKTTIRRLPTFDRPPGAA